MATYDRTKKSIAILLALFGLCAVVASTKRFSSGDLKPRTFWNALRIGGANEAEGYSTFAEMRDASDHVVLARMTSFEPGYVIQGDAPEDVLTVAKAGFEVEDALRGDSFVGGLSVDFLVPMMPGEALEAIEALGKALPDEPMLLFVRDKRDKSGGRRLVSFEGLWTEVDGAVEAPLAEDGGRLKQKFAGVVSVEELSEFVESVR